MKLAPAPFPSEPNEANRSALVSLDHRMLFCLTGVLNSDSWRENLGTTEVQAGEELSI